MAEEENKLLKYWPLWGAALIAFGAEYLLFYYSVFNIQIMEFIEWSEIVQSFLSRAVILVFFGLLGTIQIFLIQNNNDREMEQRNYELAINERRLAKRIQFYFYSYSIFFWLLLGELLVYFVNLKLHFLVHMSTWWLSIAIYLSIMTFLIVINEIRLKIANLNATDDYKTYVSYTFVLFVAFCTIAFLAYKEAKSVIDQGIVNMSITSTSDSALIIGKNDKYVGKTKNFVFLYNDSSKTTRVISASIIKEIKFNASFH